MSFAAGKNVFFTVLFSAPLLFLILLFLSIRFIKSKIFFPLFFCLFLLGFTLSIFAVVKVLSVKGNYYPAIEAKKNVKYYVVDYPPKGLERIYKKFALKWEERGTNYEILGWLDNRTMVYKKWAGGITYFDNEVKIGPEQLLQYDINRKSSITFNDSINKLYKKTCAFECVKEFIEDPTPMLGCTIVYISPNGNRFACISSYALGPEDIMIFEK